MDNKQQQATPMLHPLTPAVPTGFATHVSITPPPAKGRRTPPLATALAHGEMNRQRAGYRTEHCKDSQEARVFGTAFYHNTLRREVANEQLRTALGCVTASPLCRHDIKRIVKRMQCRLSQWDVALAHSIKRSDLVDVYDGLVERAGPLPPTGADALPLRAAALHPPRVQSVAPAGACAGGRDTCALRQPPPCARH